MRQLNDRLRNFRTEKGWSKSFIAGKLGISSQLYGQYEREENPKMPGGEFFIKWKKEFGFDLTEDETVVSKNETEYTTNQDLSALIRSNAQLADAVHRMVVLMEAKEKAAERIETNLTGITGRIQRCETYALTLYKVVQQHRSVVEQVPLKKVQSDMDKVLYSTGQEVRQASL